MSEPTVFSTYGFFESFPNKRAALVYIENLRWPKQVVCPHCHSVRTTRQRIYEYHQCRDCRKKFTVLTGTIFQRSHVPLYKWLYAIYQLERGRTGLPSTQLAREIGVTQKTAWFMLHRLRKACDVFGPVMDGEVQADEVYVSGGDNRRHFNKKSWATGMVDKTPALGLRERDGFVKLFSLQSVSTREVGGLILRHVKRGAYLYTDESNIYRHLEDIYNHKTIKHVAHQYVDGPVTTNGIESVFSAVKRTYRTYVHWDAKHQHRYLAEIQFRLNQGNSSIPLARRAHTLVRNAIGKTLTYRELTASAALGGVNGPKRPAMMRGRRGRPSCDPNGAP